MDCKTCGRNKNSSICACLGWIPKNCMECDYRSWDRVEYGSHKYWWMYCSHPEGPAQVIKEENKRDKLCPYI